MTAGDRRVCANCGDEVEVGLSSRDWCDGCEETAYELAYPELNGPTAGGVEVFAYRRTQLRTVVINGQRWAAAADICAFLDLKNVTDSLKRLDSVDKLVTHRSEALDSTKGFWALFAANVHSVNLVSEDGATDLVLDSRKPDARRFRRFLTHTVWPSIRDTGSYTVAPAMPQTREERLALAVIDAQQMLTEKNEQLAIITSEKQCLEAAIERDAPLVAKAEAHSGSDSAIHRQEFAREVQSWGRKQGIDIRHSEVMRFLGHIGLFIRGDRTDTGHATAEAQRRGLSFTDKGTAKNGHAWATGKLTSAGQDYAWKRITKYVAENGNLRLPRELRGGDPA